MKSFVVYFRDPLRQPIMKAGKDIYMFEMESYTTFKDRSGTGEDEVLLSVVTFEVLYIDWGV